MANHSSLSTLIELAEKETDTAAKKLGAAIRMSEECEKKLTLLMTYRDEYASRFQAGQSAGITVAGYRNFQAFLGKLDDAISGQQEVIAHAKKRIEVERSSWQASERKRMSYNTLVNRAQKQELRLEVKRDQKLTDEHAARQGYYKQ
ncbi:MAG: flagellar export protein FliJ [Pseudomonadota bacterium]